MMFQKHNAFSRTVKGLPLLLVAAFLPMIVFLSGCTGGDTPPANIALEHSSREKADKHVDSPAPDNDHSLRTQPGVRDDRQTKSSDSPRAAETTDDDTLPPQAVSRNDDSAVLWKPQVLMSDEHLATCTVQVGDAMPAITLPDTQGGSRTLSDLYGEKLTVVVFWTSSHIYAREQFSRLKFEVVDRYSGQGVGLVAINEGDSAQQVSKLASQYGARFANLLDADGAALKQVAQRKIPRTYLLDAHGKILWLDIEYSRSTSRELRNAIRYYLTNKAI